MREEMEDLFQFFPKEIEELLKKAEKEKLTKEDYPLLVRLIKALFCLGWSMGEEALCIEGLSRILKVKKNAAKKLIQLINEESIGNKIKRCKPPTA